MKLRVAKKIVRGHLDGRVYAKGLRMRAWRVVKRDIMHRVMTMRCGDVRVIPFQAAPDRPRGFELDQIWIDDGEFGQGGAFTEALKAHRFERPL